MIKLIASDLDGTLLTDSKELSQTTVQILDMAVKKGIYVIPATGRSFRAIPERIRNYPGIRYVITSNGGAIYSVLENKRIYQCLLNGQTVEEALDIQVKKKNAIKKGHNCVCPCPIAVIIFSAVPASLDSVKELFL